MATTPANLEAHNHYAVERLMTRDNPVLASAARLATLDMTTEDLWIPNGDHSLTRQLGDVVQTPSSISDGLKPPELIFFTAESAIPVADSVRGFYDELGLPKPRLGFVTANRKISYDAGDTVDPEEVSRLQAIVESAQHVTLIEQYSESRKTLRYGARLLLTAGAQHVTTIQGRWFQETSLADNVNRATLTSANHPFMHQVGRTAAIRRQERVL